MNIYQEPEPGPLRLYDRADGVRGHFCVGRKVGWWNEFWNEHSQSFSGAGTLYVGRELAEAKMAELKAMLKAVSPPAGEGV